MLIYKGSTNEFVEQVRKNTLTKLMAETFESQFGIRPGRAEQAAWQNSLPRVRDLIEIAGLYENTITLEYQVPYNEKRIDCLLFGKGAGGLENIVLIELKQWSSVTALQEEGNFVETYVGGSQRTIPHPSQQVAGYSDYLRFFVTEFETPPPLGLFACAYCHNYSRTGTDGLFDKVYYEILEKHPVFTREDVETLAFRLKDLLGAGAGFEVFNRFMQSRIQTSRKLLDNVAGIIKNEVRFSLINEQIVAKNKIWGMIRKASRNKTKTVVIVHGGPGTGKSVIALNELAEAATKGMKVFYGCKSKPFREGLASLVGGNGKILFSSLSRFNPTKLKEDDLDLLLVDEAHRIGRSGNSQFTPKYDRTDMPQVDQLIRCAKTVVFFIDDNQVVRSIEVGNSQLIRETAAKFGAEVDEVNLETQFRCMGSNDYLLWLEATLGYTPDKRILSKNEMFDFRIMDSPQEMYDRILKHEKDKENSARLVAGYCWPWSQTLDGNGDLVKDVRIGDFAMPWETHNNIKRLPQGYVRWHQWAYRKEGIKQVGCIYTAQGFEFDYIGVIVGPDLIPNLDGTKLVGNIEGTADPMLKRGRAHFDKYVRNIYRVLLSRGMSGCYVYFVDKGTEEFFRSRIES